MNFLRNLRHDRMGILLLGILLLQSSCQLLKRGELDDVTKIEPGSDPQMAAEQALATVKNEAMSERAQLLESFFKQGNYQEALEMSRDLKAIASDGSDEKDVASFIEGVSLYYLGRNEEAASVIKSHFENFPQSRHRESAMYFLGSNLAKLKQYRVAGEVLEKFLAQYPESILMEYALYDRALAHYGSGEFLKAAATAGQLEEKFVYSRIRDRAAALRGDALTALGKTDEAQGAYDSALARAGELNHSKTEARALRGMIESRTVAGDLDGAFDAYRKFFAKYGRTEDALKAAVAGLPAAKEKRALPEAFKNVEELLVREPESTSAAEYQQALSRYAKFYREQFGPEKLVNRLAEISADSKGSSRLHEQVIVTRLHVLEEDFPNRLAEIKVFYDEIIRSYQPKELAPETLFKVAQRIEKEKPERALEWYQEILSRSGNEMKGDATLARGLILSKSKQPNQREKGITELRRVVEQFGESRLAEPAMIGLGEAYALSDDWERSYHTWEAYLKNQNWTKAKALAMEGRQNALAKLGKTPSAPQDERVENLPSSLVQAPTSRRDDPGATSESDEFWTAGVNHAMGLAADGKKANALSFLEEILNEAKPGREDGEAMKRYRQASQFYQELRLELNQQTGLGSSRTQ